MQCDLCGKNIDTNDAFADEFVVESKLCHACFDIISADNCQESPTNVDQTGPKVPTQKLLKSLIGIAIVLLTLIYLRYVEFNIKIIFLQAIFFGPSILAALVAFFASFENKITTLKIILIAVSMFLHAISSFFVFAAVGFGEAWSGYGRNHGFPVLYGLGGALLIMLIVFRPKSTTKSINPTRKQ